ncbi:PREDICTED: uncharacterized protein LOC105125853 [Populus euphratica]|uniref:Uncharacterized protein LOC105125853 n=1 Tax=Populus euphratica TaxID=75702 RepID=A0AAJ6XMW3_POPEU|nr:PREDICTED: uncharacterized protein LOC105125853 [Populus euphratica]
MGTKGDGESQEERPHSPYSVLQHLSEEAFRVAGEALHSVYPGTDPGFKSMQRSQSEIFTNGAGSLRSSSFRKLKTRMQNAWRWGGDSRERGYMPSFNPEVLANQKRQWYQFNSKSLNHSKYKEPTSLFEHFIVAGLHPDANLEKVEDAFAREKKWESDMEKSGLLDFNSMQRRAPSFPTLEPQILFKYPPGKRLAMRSKDLAAFCFPGGVKTRLLERTPSLSELNELVYGQEHLGRDDFSFIFSLKVSFSFFVLHLAYISHIPFMAIAKHKLACSLGLKGGFKLFSYFSAIHYIYLHGCSIIAQERLNRITQFVSEMSLTACMPSVSKQHGQMNENVDCLDREYNADWMASAIPVDSAVALTAAAAGIISDDVIATLSPKIWEPQSPESVTASEASDSSQTREVDKDGRKCFQYFDDYASLSPENHCDALERIYGGDENGHVSPVLGIFSCSRSRRLDRLGSFDTLFSSVRSMVSEDDDDELFPDHENDFGDDLILEWAKENKNDLLQIICGYHAMPLPQRGNGIVFQPLDHLQAIEYKRPPTSDLGFCNNYLASFEAAEVNAKLAAAEEALALSIWTTATVCRVLSLENVLALVAGVLLEKQVVVVCPNLGVLSAVVLSLVPMIRPFQWQSLLLPILPRQMLDFLDAPVPFIVGIQHRPADLKIKTSNLVHVNVLKNQVKMCHLPTLPRYKELVSELRPLHNRLSLESSVAKRHPVYRCNEVQAEAATQFLTVMRRYLESLCSDLRSYTITSVQSNNDRVSLLLKDSFIDSFNSRDRSFIKYFVDTQLFAVLSDSRLLSFEHGSF